MSNEEIMEMLRFHLFLYIIFSIIGVFVFGILILIILLGFFLNGNLNWEIIKQLFLYSIAFFTSIQSCILNANRIGDV